MSQPVLKPNSCTRLGIAEVSEVYSLLVWFLRKLRYIEEKCFYRMLVYGKY